MSRPIESVTKIDVGAPPSKSYHQGWQAFDLHFHNFCFVQPAGRAFLSYFGFDYEFAIARTPPGFNFIPILKRNLVDDDDDDIEVECDADILCSGGSVRKIHQPPEHLQWLLQMDRTDIRGYFGFHGDLFNPRDAVLHDGTLVVRLYIRRSGNVREVEHFVPENPLRSSMKKCFEEMLSVDNKMADVAFEVPLFSGASETVQVHAHRLILQACAPGLAELCEDTMDGASILLTGVASHTFRDLLYYVYGGQIHWNFLSAEDYRDFIDAANKFGVTTLKVEAEVWYVKATTITLDNVVDNYHFADSKECPLLKEKVVDFIVENSSEVLEKMSRRDLPQSEDMMADILTAVAKGKSKEDKSNGDNPAKLNIMSIDALRRKLDERGLSVDGTRDMLIDALKEAER